MFKNVTLACLSLVAALLAGRAGAQAQPMRPGPRLKVVVYVKDTQNPIHGATVTITDAWGYFDRAHSSADTTNPRGEALFGPTAFKYWTIERGRMYRAQDPWDWVAVPGQITGSSSGSVNGQEHHTVRRSPPVMAEFKVAVKVEKSGFRPASGSAVVRRAGTVATFYLSQGREAEEVRPRRQPPAEPRLMTDIHEQADARSFSLGKNAEINLAWPNGRRAVSATLRHTHIVRDEKPNGAGLWLSVYAFNNQGQGNAFHGSKDILLANTETGETAIREGRSYRIDCGDLIIEYQLNPFRPNPPEHAGWAWTFEGTLRMTARMRIAPAAPPPAPPAVPAPPAAPAVVSTPTSAPAAGQVNFCSHCGARLPEGAAFCPACGSKVIRSVTAAPESSIAWPFDANEAKRRQRETAATLGVPQKLSVDLGKGVTMEFVLIPAGQFTMGSPSDEAGRPEKEDNEQLHRVTITRPYYMAATEVTQAQWRAVMGSNPSTFKGSDRLPVETVSWQQAMDFCRKVSAKVGREVRLPTEAEWEYACRAGTSTAYQWGGDPDDGRGWCNCGDQTARRENPGWSGYFTWSDGHVNTAPVGSFRANAFGLYDMHGNVWEWCSDWYASDCTGFGVNDPQGPAAGHTRVFRGGCWFDDPTSSRSAYRCWNSPDICFGFLGFRPAIPTSERVRLGDAHFKSSAEE